MIPTKQKGAISCAFGAPEGIRTPIVGTGNQNSIH